MNMAMGETDEIPIEDFLAMETEEDLIVEEGLIEEKIFLYKLPFIVFPLFETAHYLLTAVKIRKQYGLQVSR